MSIGVRGAKPADLTSKRLQQTPNNVFDSHSLARPSKLELKVIRSMRITSVSRSRAVSVERFAERLEPLVLVVASFLTASFQKFDLENGPSPWEI